MTPPEAPDTSTGTTPPAASACPDTIQGDTPAPAVPLQTLRVRRDFLAAARAARQGSASMTVQGRQRPAGEAGNAIRVGFTCSKKVGNAVARNRAKRRLREAARDVLPRLGRPGWDYVLIGRPEATAARPFDALKRDLEQALHNLHKARR
jgi:ribonuclease P protein component